MNATIGPALILMSGRMLGFVASFLIPLVLVRLLEPHEFGSYKQLFLVHATLFTAAQLGMAESLYYFLPRDPRHAARYIANAGVALALSGLACFAALSAAAPRIADLMNNPGLAPYLPLVGLSLAILMASIVLEIALTARNRYGLAASSYLLSDVLRAVLLVAPVYFVGGLRALLVGAVLFAGMRLAAAIACLRRDVGAAMTPDPRLLGRQLAYALPFAAAVLVHVMQENIHQYVVSARYDAATFAIYAIGCLQVPLVEFLATSASNVMMVRMAEGLRSGRTAAALAIWHDTTRKLALLFCPLVALLILNAREIVLVLFTEKFTDSAPILRLWSLAFLAAVLQIDGVLRAYAETRFLLVMNVARLVLILVLIGPLLDLFGMPGAVLVTLAALFGGKAMALARVGRLLAVPARDVLPWGDLVRTLAAAAAAMAPAHAIRAASALSPWPSLLLTGAVYFAAFGTLVAASRRLHAPRARAPRAGDARWSAPLTEPGRTVTR